MIIDPAPNTEKVISPTISNVMSINANTVNSIILNQLLSIIVPVILAKKKESKFPQTLSVEYHC